MRRKLVNPVATPPVALSAALLNVPVAVGTGASFKFIGGTASRAPKLVRNLGFEWLWRLAHEPKRVWRRVVLDAPRFILLVSLQLSGIKKYKPRT